MTIWFIGPVIIVGLVLAAALYIAMALLGWT